MIYDNKYSLVHAERIVKDPRSKDPAWLIKEISGELNRFYCLGRYSLIEPLEKLIKKAKADKP